MRQCLITVILFLMSCIINRKFTTVIFYDYRMNIPKGYINHLIIAGSHGNEYQYWYTDSVLLYISNESGMTTPNYDNIKQAGYGSKKFEFFIKHGDFNGEPLELSGKNQKGFYWKEISIGEMYFGYKNVPLEKKEIFDKALYSIQKK